jgi:hypothetical protein
MKSSIFTKAGFSDIYSGYVFKFQKRWIATRTPRFETRIILRAKSEDEKQAEKFICFHQIHPSGIDLCFFLSIMTCEDKECQGVDPILAFEDSLDDCKGLLKSTTAG